MRRLSLKYREHLRKWGSEGILAPMDLPMLEIRWAAEHGELGSIVT
jgi:hypothetical protein